MGLNLPEEADLTCDKCGECENVPLTGFVGAEVGELKGFALEDLPDGWRYNDEDEEFYCPNCDEYRDSE